MLIVMAWRNIWRNKTRSLVIILSVAIGFFAGIAVLALYKGMLRSRLRTVIDQEIGHLQIHHKNFKNDYEAAYTIPDRENILSFLHKLPEIKSFTERSITQGMLATTTGSAGVQINGINLPAENEVSGIAKKIMEGTLPDTTMQNQLIISKKLADKMKVTLNNKVVLTFTDKENNINSAAFRITGIYQTINTPLDERNIFVLQKDLNPLLGIGNNFHEICIVLEKDESLNEIQQKIEYMYPTLFTENWKEISPETELMVASSSQYMYIIIIIIMLALLFGIVNTMLMAILERTREIGMMTALGMTKNKLFILVLLETTLLTIAGTPFGFLTAWVGNSYFSRKGIDISSFAGKAMSNFGFESVIYPEFPYESIITVLVIVVFTALAAALLPSLKALKLVPANALRR